MNYLLTPSRTPYGPHIRPIKSDILDNPKLRRSREFSARVGSGVDRYPMIGYLITYCYVEKSMDPKFKASYADSVEKSATPAYLLSLFTEEKS